MMTDFERYASIADDGNVVKRRRQLTALAFSEQLLYGYFSVSLSRLISILRVHAETANSIDFAQNVFVFLLRSPPPPFSSLYFLLWEFLQIPLCEIKLLAS